MINQKEEERQLFEMHEKAKRSSRQSFSVQPKHFSTQKSGVLTTSEKSFAFKNKLAIQDVESERPEQKIQMSFVNKALKNKKKLLSMRSQEQDRELQESIVDNISVQL